MKKGISRVLSYFSEVTELPLNELTREYSVNLAGRNRLTVDGVISINKYEKERIVLEVKGGRLYVSGAGMLLKTFYHTTLYIIGEINCVEWGDGKCGD